MILRAITLCNYGIYRGEQAIVPATGCGDSGRVMTLIGGLNGRGKTSLLDAVMLALYGRRSPSVVESGRTYPAYLKGLINKNASKHEESWCEVHLDLPADGYTFSLRVRRSWRLNTKRVSENLSVYRNGLRDSILEQSWDSYVEELIPLGIGSLFFFDGEKIGKIAESDETPEHLQRAIQCVLGIDLVDEAIARLDSIIRRHSNRMSDSQARRQLSEIQEQWKAKRLEADSIQQEIESANEEIRRLQLESDLKEQEYLGQGGAFLKNRAEAENEYASLERSLEQAKLDLVNLASGPLPLLLVMPLVERVNEGVQKELIRRQADAALPLIAKRNAEVLELLEKDLAGNDLLARIRRLLSEQEAALKRDSNLEQVFPITPVGIAQVENLVNGLATTLRSEATSGLEVFRVLEARMSRVHDHLLSDIDEEKVSAALQDLARLAKEIATLQQRKDYLEARIVSLEHEMAQIENTMDKLCEQIVAVGEAERVIQYAAKCKSVLSGFRETLVERKVASLTGRISEAFSSLTNKTSLVSTFRIDPSTLRITLLDSDNRVISKSQLSSGEKQMLAVAILWGLAQASGRKLPVIIDTPMGRLDSSHRMNFVTRYLPNASHQVIVLSTDTEITGPYLEMLQPCIGRQYLLSYDDASEETRITEGYFSTGGIAG
ncbi:MAG: DNA sulfur modification protein DndD [Ignavibacteriales bacterium]